MFIEPATNIDLRSSGAHSASDTRHRLRFRSSGARRNLLEIEFFYKHYVPPGRQKLDVALRNLRIVRLISPKPACKVKQISDSRSRWRE